MRAPYSHRLAASSGGVKAYTAVGPYSPCNPATSAAAQTTTLTSDRSVPRSSAISSAMSSAHHGAEKRKTR